MNAVYVAGKKLRVKAGKEAVDFSSFSGQAFYDGTDFRVKAALEDAFSEKDVAYSGNPAEKPPTYCFSKQRAYIHPFQQWGADSVDELIPIEDALRESAVSTSLYGPGKILKDLMSPLVGGAQRPGCRQLCLDAIHQGHMGIYGAHSENAVLFDRKQAFLRAFDWYFPDSYEIVENPKNELVSSILKKPSIDGILQGAAWYEPGSVHIPTLPASTSKGNFYGDGLILGSWTLDMIRAEKGRIKLKSCSRLVVFKGKSRKYASLFDKLSSIKYKPARKALYTRAWGMLASSGGMEGRKGKDGFRFMGSRLFWTKSYEPGENGVAGPLFRPIDAVVVASSNHVAMQKAIIQHESHVLMAHVDALIIGDCKIKLDNTFDRKIDGRVECFAIGNYAFSKGEDATRVRTMGCKLPKTAKTEQERYVSALSWWATQKDDTRTWGMYEKDGFIAGVYPQDSYKAVSKPKTLDAACYVKMN